MVIEELSIEDLVDNPTPRIPIAMVLDTSASMAGAPIKELNKGVNLFIEEIRRDEYTRYSAEICIVTFGGSVEINPRLCHGRLCKLSCFQGKRGNSNGYGSLKDA